MIDLDLLHYPPFVDDEADDLSGTMPRSENGQKLLGRKGIYREETAREWAECLRDRLTLTFNFPLCLLGFAINALVVWVWNGERTFRPTSYFIKALAVIENLARLLWAFFMISHARGVPSQFLYLVRIYVYGNISAGIYIIMLMAMARFTLVFFGLETMKRLFSRQRTRVALAVLLTLCYANEFGIKFAYKWCLTNSPESSPDCHDEDVWTIWFVTVMTPVIVQIVLMSLVLWKINQMVWKKSFPAEGLVNSSSSFRFSRLLRSKENAKVAPADGQPPAGFEESRDFRALALSQSMTESRIGALKKARMVEYTVFILCLNSFILYPGLALLLLPFYHVDSLRSYHPVAMSFLNSVYLITSCWNIMFYLVFLSHFRSLLIYRFSTLRQRCAIGEITSDSHRSSNNRAFAASRSHSRRQSSEDRRMESSYNRSKSQIPNIETPQSSEKSSFKTGYFRGNKTTTTSLI